ncbi:hypothetical protein HFN89_03125 [Rhizobium laguerreae]|nr:hypothetical protein [Rhizobium laguerreae]
MAAEKTSPSRPETPVADKPTLWFASVDTGYHQVHAFGITPEAAVKALAETWAEHAEPEGVDVGLLGHYRDSIEVAPVTLGRGYAKGTGDRLWYTGVLGGDDVRFDEFLPPPTSKRDQSPGYR